ncbi:MAG: MGMT family protein [Candidatus ainarchaeum sp.]|nr:MGMT family protein [Candidatus ainarchaeum sp.]
MHQKSFNEKVWDVLRMVPSGKVSTYKAIAIALGKPDSARAVGNACNKNPFSPEVPCHRVVKSNGELGGFAKGTKKKARLLEKEGIKIKNSKILNFDKVIFKFK